MRLNRHIVRCTSFLLIGTSLYSWTAAKARAETDAVHATPADTGEITVTAQKRSEKIQHVPISIQAITSEKLEQHQVQSFDDYSKQLPSVSFESFGPGQSQIFFRGISSGAERLSFGTLPTSGVYIDDIPVTAVGALLDMHIYDVSRLEALSGPQGTLYGASSLSGTLRIITNKPDPNSLSAAIDVTGAKYGKGNAGGTVEGFVNVPLSEHAAVRIVGWYEHDGGYIDNTFDTRTYERPHTVDGSVVTSPIQVNNAAFVKNNFNDVDTYGGRVAFAFELENGWTISPVFIAQHQHSNGSFLYDPHVGDLAVHDFTPEYNIDEWYQAALTVQGKIGTWDALYSGGYMGRNIRTAADYSYYTVAYDTTPDVNFFQTADGHDIDPTQYYSNIQRITKQTHEIRLNSPGTDRLRLTAGLFFQRQANHSIYDYYVPNLSQNVVTTWVDGSTVYGDTIYLTDARVVDKDYAAFGQGTFDLAPSLSLTAGIRGFLYRNTMTGSSGYASDFENIGCTVPLPSIDSCPNLNKRASGSGETHKVNLAWKIDNDRMIYLTYSTGFRPGNANRRPGVDPYQPDTLDNFEFGWKTSWLDRKVYFNGAIYYEKWNKLQYSLAVAGSGGIVNIYNAGNARVYGAEADIQVRPARGLTVSASGAYNDAALTTNFCAIGSNGNPDCSNGQIAAPKGTRLPTQPRFKMNATARYEFALGQVDAHVQGSMMHQSSSASFLDVADNALVGDSPQFSTFDFSVGGKKGLTSVEVFIQNAFDERGSLSHNVFTAPSTSGQYYRIYPIKPQYFGIKFGRKF
jgi:iron complex outermembrane recepter protein